MSSLLPEEKISEIKNTADILEIVSDSVILKKAGRNHKGLCPFHSEKTPSFTVDPQKQMFKCFGCGEGGNVFTFLMKRDGVSFPEAVRMLGRRYGIEVDTRNMSPEARRRAGERERLFDLNSLALEYFRGTLRDPGIGKKAMDYLISRGLKREVVDAFNLGYVPAGWDNLSRYLGAKRIPGGLVEKSGLVVNNENGRRYDRFRDRIIFPIHDIAGQVVGFGGRVMDDGNPKYLNSPETPVYSKKNSLYGLNMARRMCRQTGDVFIVEGYFDLLALFNHGIENVAATLGTALTEEQVRLLKGYAARMILVYDSDNAGIKAALRSVELFSRQEVDARILVLPEGYDPDSFIFEHGPEKFMETAGGALTIMEFLMDRAVKRHGLSVEGKVRILTSMTAPLAGLKDSVARSLYIRRLAERIDVEEAAVLERIREGGTGPAPSVPREKIPVPRENFSRMEKQILAMMLQFPEIMPELAARDLIGYFREGTLKEIGRLVLGRSTTDISLLMSGVDENTRRVMASLTIGDDVWDREGCVRLMDQFVSIRSRERDTLLREIKAAEESNNHDLLLELLNKKMILAGKGR